MKQSSQNNIPCKFCYKLEMSHTILGYCLIDSKYDIYWGQGGSRYEPMDNLTYLEYKCEQSSKSL